MAKFLSILSLLPMVLIYQTSMAQVSKPKEPRRSAKKAKVVEVQEIETISELKKVMSRLKSQSTVGQFYDLLKPGIAATYLEALLKKLAASGKDWRKGQLPSIEVAEKGFKVSSGEKSVAAEYILEDEVFAKLNDQVITFDQAADPEQLIRRVEEIVGEKESRRKASFFWNLILPRAEAGFSLSLNITGIIQMIFMFKMMKMMMKVFKQPRNHSPYPPYGRPHPHYYHYQYRYQQRYNGRY